MSGCWECHTYDLQGEVQYYEEHDPEKLRALLAARDAELAKERELTAMIRAARDKACEQRSTFEVACMDAVVQRDHAKMELQQARERGDKLEGQCAVMFEALKAREEWLASDMIKGVFVMAAVHGFIGDGGESADRIKLQVLKALASDAGASLLTELRALREVAHAARIERNRNPDSMTLELERALDKLAALSRAGDAGETGK